MPGGARSSNFSVPTLLCEQHLFQVSLHSLAETGSSSEPELAELKEMLKKTARANKSVDSQFVSPTVPPRHHRFNPRSVICCRYQQSGHFARDCPNNHGPPPARISVLGPQDCSDRPQPPAQPSEN